METEPFREEDEMGNLNKRKEEKGKHEEREVEN